MLLIAEVNVKNNPTKNVHSHIYYTFKKEMVTRFIFSVSNVRKYFLYILNGQV